MLSDHCLSCLSVFNVGVLWPNGWMNQDESWRGDSGDSSWILLEQEMMGLQWHQLDHILIICASLQTDNRSSTSPLKFFSRLDGLPVTHPTASNH